jgi:5-methylcytosine-specific restriction protein B
LETLEELARAMLVDHLPARVKALNGGPVNYLRFGAERLISYELDERIAERLGVPPRADAPRVDRSPSVLDHFDINQAFRQARARWTDSETRAFIEFAQAIHEVGLDWYFVQIPPYELRYGRKPPGRDAQEVVGIVDGSPARMRLRQLAPEALKAIGDGFVPIDGALMAWVAKHHELLASRSAPDRDVGMWPDEYGAEQLKPESDQDLQDHGQMTTNLILYGPPGTGKTYETAREAVRLCGEEPPVARDALMARYRTLTEAGRIEFVTFHQSMAYEEFVEGLRPSATDENGQPLAGGFRLAPTPGIFRRIARRAETSTGPGIDAFTVGSRKVFKMSLGDATNADDAYLFEEAIRDGHIVLGFEDIDWSDPKYAKRDEIMAACQAVAPPDTRLNAQSAVVQMPHIFRNWMREDDVVIVSKGTKLFRAIGVITGGYRFAPRDGGDYGHQRNVRWLWVDRDGVPVEEIYARGFSMRTTYEMFSRDLNIPALERYANSQQNAGSGAPEPFVLVIDEINRANISKVFGELITLLEPDKRLGGTNALKVRLPYSGDLFGVPANLHIVGTMNTADRSIALIDKALRRRFTFREMMPDYTVEGMGKEVVGAGVTLADVLATLNNQIEYLLDREHQIGHGWLLGCSTKQQLDAAMRDKVIPLIAEYFFEDWGRTADVLGGREDNPFLEALRLAPPRSLSGTEPRYRWLVRSEFASDAYLRLVDRA